LGKNHNFASPKPLVQKFLPFFISGPDLGAWPDY